MTTIQNNLTEIKKRIETTAHHCDRSPEKILLLAVSKTKSVSQIQEAIDAGQTRFGENYVQEAVEKITYFANKPDNPSLEWHFIGPLQSNKSRLVAEHFDWVHTVDREKIARRLSEQRPENLPALNVLIQINIDNQASKSGIATTQLFELADQIELLPKLTLRGIMVIPAPESDVNKQFEVFKRTELLYLQLQQRYPHIDTLSMGMSDDMVAAIEAGSTMVRIGTAIFGHRN